MNLRLILDEEGFWGVGPLVLYQVHFEMKQTIRITYWYYT